jgi:hypothetical protein
MERDGEGWRGMERDGEGWRGMEREGGKEREGEEDRLSHHLNVYIAKA